VKRAVAIGATLLLLPLLVRLLIAQAPPPSQAPPPPPTYTLTDLGRMDLSAAPSGPTAISSTGQVAGLYFNYTTQVNRAFVWSNGTLTELGTLGGSTSFGYGVNSAGQVVGFSSLPTPTQRAFIWQNGVMTNLGDPTGDSNLYSAAFAINTAGDVGGYENRTVVTPVIWKGGTHAGATVLSSLPCQFNFCAAQVLALNDAGQAAGFGTGPYVTGPAGSYNATQAVMWDANGQATGLGSLGNYVNDHANAINSQGAVVGYSQINSAMIHAVLWQNGTMTDLGAIPGIDPLFGPNANISDNSSGAWGVNSKGQIVGISAYGTGAVTQGNGGRAFLYTNGTMYDLLSLVPGTNWKLLHAAWAINDAGQIVGVGIDPTTNTDHGFLLTPIITPTTTAVATSGTPSVFGQQVSFTATVTPSASNPNPMTGTVTFKDGAVTLGSVPLSAGVAIFNTTALSVGGHSITASYGGDNQFGSSTSAAVTQVVNQAATTTALAVSSNPANFGQTVTLTATVTVGAPGTGTPTGTVNFLDGTTSTSLGTAVLNSAGSATISTSSLGTGSHSVSASYSGDANFTRSASAATNLSVVLPAPAITSPASGFSTTNSSVTITGTGVIGALVAVLDGTTTVASIPVDPAGNFSVTVTLAVGANSLTATQTLNGVTSAPSAAVVGTVLPLSVAIAVNENIKVSDTTSLPDVFSAEAVHVNDTVFVTPLIQVSAPVVQVSAGILGFNGQSGSQTITMSSIGTASLTVASATISGSSQFAVTQIACSNGATSLPTMLPSGAACALTIGYSASATPANDNGTLVFTDSAALGNVTSVPAGSSFTQSIPLSGGSSTTAPPPAPPAVIPIRDNEAIHVTDAISFADVFDAETIKVNDVVTLNMSPAITSANNTTFILGVANSFVVTTTGAPAPALTKSGVLPQGVTFTDNGNGTATLGGTPAARTVGTYPIVITAHNALAPDAIQNFTLTVDQAPGIISPNQATFLVGAPGFFTVQATGFPTPTLSKSGTLPSGVTFDSVAGVLSGPPAAGTDGTYPITFTAHNGVAADATQAFTLTVLHIPSTTTMTSSLNPSLDNQTSTFTVTVTLVSPPPGFNVGSNASLSLSVDGQNVASFGSNGSPLPVFSGSPNLTATVSLPIPIPYPGAHTVTAMFSSNGSISASSASVTQTVNPLPAALSLSSSSNPSTFLQGTQIMACITATLSPPTAFLTNPGSIAFQVDGGNVVNVPAVVSSACTGGGPGAVQIASATLPIGRGVLSPGSHTISAAYVCAVTCFLTPSSGSLTQTVNNNRLTITASNASRQYGQPNPPLNNNVTYSGFVNGDGPGSLSGSLICTITATQTSPVGLYPIQCSGLTSSNYLITFAPGTLRVTAAPLTITANNTSRPYGQANPPLSKVTYSGFVNGDGPASLTGTLNCNTTATPASVVGSYPITCSGLTSTNYTITFVGGTLSVTPATPTITWANPAPITLGTMLSSTQLNAAASVAGVTLQGTFAYSPPLNTVLSAGTHTLSVTFIPADARDYQIVTASVSIAVNVSGNLSVQPGQNVTFTNGSISGNVTLSGGTLTLNNSTVGGNLTMSSGSLTLGGNSTVSGNVLIQGGSFSIGPATIRANLQITNIPRGATPGVVCGAIVSGNVQFQGNAIPGQVGPASCPGVNIISGSLQITNNTAPLQIYKNAVGGNLQVQSNTGSAQVFQNTVQGVLQCSGNSSPFTGGRNTAASKQGQCANF